MDKKISGMTIYYWFVCKRKLWYFINEIRMEKGNEDVLMGKIIDEYSYNREKKHINIDNTINIDYIESKNIIHEVKKSRSIEEASIWQVKYYIYYLQKRGVSGLRGKIDYPLLHKSIDVVLTDDDIQSIDKIIVQINSLTLLKHPPEFVKKDICKKCAYRDLCFI